MTPLSDRVLEAIRGSGLLCLNVTDPGWDDARGYLFDEAARALYFPVAKKYLPGNPSGFQVVIWGRPRVLITGDLSPATSEDDAAHQLRLAAAGGMDETDARVMILDRRNGKPRRTRLRLTIRTATLLEP